MRNILFFCLLLAARGNAQTVVYSAPENFKSNTYNILGSAYGNIYIYHDAGNKGWLDSYSSSMTKIGSYPLDFLPRNYSSVRFICYDSKMIIIYKVYKTGVLTQMAAVVDERGHLERPPVELNTLKTHLIGDNHPHAYTAVSDNKQEIFVCKLLKQDGKSILEAKWFNDDLTCVKQALINIETDNITECKEMYVANNGDVFSSMTNAGGKQYYFIALSMGKNSLKVIPVPLADTHIASTFLKIDNEYNCVYFGGYYSNTKMDYFDGLLCNLYDMRSDSICSQSYYSSKIGQYKGSTNMRLLDKRQFSDNYKVFLKSQGGFFLVSEIRHIDWLQGISSRGYFSNDAGPVLVFSYTKDNVNKWVSIVPEYRKGISYDASCAILYNNEDILFVCNNIGGMHVNDEKYIAIDSTGKADFQRFADKNKSIKRLGSGMQISQHAFIAPCIFDKQICFAKISF